MPRVKSADYGSPTAVVMCYDDALHKFAFYLLLLTPKGVPRSFHWEQDRTAEGRERGWGSWGGAATPSPSARGPVERCELPQRVRGGAPTTQRFCHYFKHSGMASPDTIILLIVDYHAAIGRGQDPRGPFAYAPVYVHAGSV